MKKIIFLIIGIAGGCQLLHSQNLPGAYTVTSSNYVRSWVASKPVADPIALSTTAAVVDFKLATQYFDGLGRPQQGVQKGITPAGKDMVSPVIYDAYGREQYKYLSYASPGSDGSFKLNPFTEQKNFYSDANSTSPIKSQGETYYYGQTIFEASPLNRVTEVQAPGNSWVASGRGVETKYYTNTDIDLVKNWVVTNNATVGNFGTYAVSSTNGSYDAGTLYKTISEDERGKQVIEFKDNEGKVILKKVQLTASNDDGTGKNHSGLLCTYYIYDDLGNLRCVVPPAAVELIKTSWQLTDATILSELCFRYEYDERNRMIVKQVPGAQPVYMVYDARDRLVMTQDGNLSGTKWMVTVYDDLNRPVKTGLWTNSSTPATHRNAAKNLTPYPTITSGFEILTETFYDNYTWLTSSPPPFTGTFDASQSSSGFFSLSNSNSPFAQSISAQIINTGLITGTKTKIVGTSSSYLYSVIYYDDHNRVIQVKSNNITSTSTAVDITTNQYSFDGRLLATKTGQTKSGSNAQTHTIITKNTYDAAGRVTNIAKNIDNTGDHSIADYTYDELGQLITRKVGPAFNSNGGVTNLSYEYNIRGWLLSCNRSQMLTDNVPSVRKFAFQIGYDKTGNSAGQGFTAAQYNGNIAGIVWKSSGDGIRRKYDFTYDNASRLMQANFVQNNGGTSTWDNSQVNYNVKMGDGNSTTSAYDNNGNIIRMQQWGLKIGSSSQIDNLTYNYTTKSNKLLNVTDGFNDAQTTMGDFRVSSLSPNQTKTTTTVDYTYDANGNMLKDLNKDIGTATASGIVYNYLNLPQTVTVQKSGGPKGTITYTYDGAGNKLKKVTVDYSTSGKTITTTTTYLGGFVYESRTTSPADANNPDYTDVLQFLGHEEGRIRRKTDGTFTWDYFIKDHLGNVRMVLTEEAKTDMYPAATMETASASTEELYYANLPATRTDVATVSGYPANTPSGNTRVAKVTGTTGGNNIGPAITLKVMAGDKFSLTVNSWWKSTNTPGTPVSIVNSLVSALTSGIPGASSGKVTGPQLTSSGLLPGLANDFLNTQTYTATKPKAYVNWVLFDEQFKFVGSGSGTEQVDVSNVYKTHTKTNLSVTLNGYLYVYVSNATPNIDVFFDNLQATHIRGTLLEETHYYPFGLTMAGISSKAAGGITNKNKYNGYELNSDFDINLYESFYRTHDPQIGRFLQIDPKPNDIESPYAAMGNNPVLHMDILGDTTVPGGGFWSNLWGGIKDGGSSTVDFVKSLGTAEGWGKVGNGIIEMQPVTNIYHAIKGEDGAFVSMGKGAANYVADIPNKSKDQIGHDLGFGLEKTAEAVVLSKGAGAVSKVVQGAKTEAVFRVFGGDAKAEGFSWTPKNPNSVSNFRDAAGLPSGGASGSNNTGRFVIEGTVKKNNIMQIKTADPLDGNRGGLPEYIINPKNVQIKRVSGVNPQF